LIIGWDLYSFQSLNNEDLIEQFLLKCESEWEWLVEGEFVEVAKFGDGFQLEVDWVGVEAEFVADVVGEAGFDGVVLGAEGEELQVEGDIA
jgi:hypothetical protein